ncbi:hypothetical protein NKH80_24735 [Mesorhizobium sp. M0904]|uniref:hypothetical protein n=1 Tax=Mesorhizobium sp. M0904 TaxID=2957022 RepID=UPI00333776C1
MRRAIQAASGLSILALAAGLKKPDLQKVKPGNGKLFLSWTARPRFIRTEIQALLWKVLALEERKRLHRREVARHRFSPSAQMRYRRRIPVDKRR